MVTSFIHKKQISAASILLAAVFFVVFIGPVMAHKYYAALSAIEYNPREKRIELVHRFFAHDVEAYLTELEGEDILWDNPDRMDPLLKDMLQENFSLAIAEQGVQKPDYIGYEVVGQLMYVYQMLPWQDMAKPISFAVENNLLMGRFHEQVNTVNIQWGADRLSTNFLKNDVIKTLQWD